jgi:RecB family exonuclease
LDGVLSGRAEGEIDLDKVVLSPSSLLLFNECQKKYEYKYVYNMPEGKVVNWEAMRLGSFVHSVLEKGVNANFREVKEFLDLAREMHMSEDWESVELEDAEHLVRVFFERNKDKYCENSRTEQRLNFEMGGVKFTGLADRIDFGPEGPEIINYKTGVSSVPPLTRNWQLGYYALAASQFGRVLKITLDMLKQEKPLEFEVDEEGRARAVNHTGRMEFNIYEVEEELVKAAHAVMEAYKKGFRACGVEKNCEFCSEYVYGL